MSAMLALARYLMYLMTLKGRAAIVWSWLYTHPDVRSTVT